MKFAQAVHNTPALADAFQRGLQALRRDAQYIHCDTPRILAGSVNVEAALQNTAPDAPRWDYAVGIECDRNRDAVIWIEIHPASSTGEVRNVLNKLCWLKGWAAEAAPDIMRLTREYVWVATGSVAFSNNSPQRRLLAAKGLRFTGSPYRVERSP